MKGDNVILLPLCHFGFYNPLENLQPGSPTCFLTGADLKNPDDNITVFPAWILDRFLLRDQKFKMIDQVTSVLYGALKLPCSVEAAKAFNDLEFKIQEAFNKDYEGVTSLSSQELFLWMSKIVYGVLYHDLLLATAFLPASRNYYWLCEKQTLLK